MTFELINHTCSRFFFAYRTIVDDFISQMILTEKQNSGTMFEISSLSTCTNYMRFVNGTFERSKFGKRKNRKGKRHKTVVTL